MIGKATRKPTIVVIADRSLWFSAREIAALCLSGVPHHQRRVNERAAAEKWARQTADDGSALSRPRAKRGGGIEYHYSVLPKRAQQELIEKINSRAPRAQRKPAPSARTIVKRSLATMNAADRRHFLLLLLAKELRG